jgi:hypothetical protein
MLKRLLFNNEIQREEESLNSESDIKQVCLDRNYYNTMKILANE